MFGNPESWMRDVLEINNSDKKDIAQQTIYYRLKRGGGSEPSDSTWELASDDDTAGWCGVLY
jgi:hypothetical protein